MQRNPRLHAIGPLLLVACAFALHAQPMPAPAAPAPDASGAPAPDTTGPINRPLITEIAKDTYFINEFGADSIYVVIGDKRALVIDTGSGFCDLKAIIAGLTKLPYDVAITHGHPDHAGGMDQFDTVYMNPADIDLARKMTDYATRLQYGHIMRGMNASALGSSAGFPNVWGYDDTSVRKFDHQAEIKPLNDLQVFDLGGRKVTAYHIPGHTPGSTVLIDDKSRILFSGDAANGNVGAGGTVIATLRGLLRIRAMRGVSYDRQYTGHIAYANKIEAISQDPQVLDDLIEDFRSILRGNPQTKVIHNHLFPERTQTVAIYGKASVGFNPDQLWGPNEPHVIP